MRFILGILPLFILIACKPLELNPAERALDVNQADTAVTTVDRYFSNFSYGDSLRFYHFKGQNSVLLLSFPNANSQLSLTAKVYLFAKTETPETIALWINNQHSDAIVGNAPQPTSSTPIDASNYAIVASELLDTETGLDGFIYDNYKVTFHVDPVIEVGVFQLAEFSDAVVVHLRKDPIATTTEQVLDVTAADTNITTVDQYFSLYRYGSSLRLYHFQAQNAVLKLVFPNQDSSFYIQADLVFFADSASLESISHWLNNQYSDALYADAAVPTRTIALDNNFNVSSSQLVDQTVGSAGDAYDNYQVEFFTNTVTEPAVYRLAGFSDNIIVHVLTKPIGPL